MQYTQRRNCSSGTLFEQASALQGRIWLQWHRRDGKETGFSIEHLSEKKKELVRIDPRNRRHERKGLFVVGERMAAAVSSHEETPTRNILPLHELDRQRDTREPFGLYTS